MKHLEIEQLKKYGERQLSGAELPRVVLHLDDCEQCFEQFQKLFPAVSDAARKVSLDALTADEGESFHLDYAAHLRPFVDGEADAVTSEIVESHLANCAFCARAANELREFSKSLNLLEIKKENAAEPFFSGAHLYQPRGVLIGNAGRLFLSVVAVVILGVGGWLFWRPTETRNYTAESQTPNVAPSIQANENNFNRQPENPAANREIEQSNLPDAPREDRSANKQKDAAEDKIRDANLAEDEILLAALPPEFRVQYQNAVRTQRVNVPSFVADLRRKDNLRGESNNQENVVLTPDAQAVRDSRPVFKWQLASGDGSYVVTLYDEDFNQIAVSPSLRVTNWQPNTPLVRGKIYGWQVKAEKSSESYAARFKVLDEDAVARLNKIENASRSPLARGIGYASEGLLIEAEREFQKETARNPRGILAKKLKNSLAKKRRR